MTVAEWCEHMIGLMPMLAEVATFPPMLVLLGVVVIGIVIGIIFYLVGC